jgi:hypothetical protein
MVINLFIVLFDSRGWLISRARGHIMDRVFSISSGNYIYVERLDAFVSSANGLSVRDLRLSTITFNLRYRIIANHRYISSQINKS